MLLAFWGNVFLSFLFFLFAPIQTWFYSHWCQYLHVFFFVFFFTTDEASRRRDCFTPELTGHHELTVNQSFYCWPKCFLCHYSSEVWVSWTSAHKLEAVSCWWIASRHIKVSKCLPGIHILGGFTAVGVFEDRSCHFLVITESHKALSVSGYSRASHQKRDSDKELKPAGDLELKGRKEQSFFFFVCFFFVICRQDGLHVSILKLSPKIVSDNIFAVAWGVFICFSACLLLSYIQSTVDKVWYWAQVCMCHCPYTAVSLCAMSGWPWRWEERGSRSQRASGERVFVSQVHCRKWKMKMKRGGGCVCVHGALVIGRGCHLWREINNVFLQICWVILGGSLEWRGKKMNTWKSGLTQHIQAFRFS